MATEAKRTDDEDALRARVEERLAGLNDAQRDAVLTVDGPLLILAGAGSGKTRVLTHRIAHLIDAVGVRPEEILAITFTNKAATEMRERVGALVGGRIRSMWVMTFHAACARILRSEAARLGYTRSFTVYDGGDQRRLMKRVLDDLDVDQKRFPPQSVLNRVSDAKNRLEDPETVAERAGPDRFQRLVAEAYAGYQARLLAANAMDFDDLLVRTVELFRAFEDVLDGYQRSFRYLMVDEYQDTNRAQYELVRLLAAGHHNLAVVGDDDQSIYGWRGADITNILRFEEDFPEAAVVTLDRNYRSTQHILSAAHGIVSQARRRADKRLRTHLGDGERVRVVELEDEIAEARFVCREIERLTDAGEVRAADCAVFYRTNAQSRVIEETLRRFGLDYQVVGGTRFYDRAEIKDALAYLQLLQNPDDGVALARAVAAPRRGIGGTTIAKLLAHADAAGIGLGEVLGGVNAVPGIGAGPAARVREFAAALEGWRALALEHPDGAVGPLLDRILDESGTRDALRADRSIEAEGRLENLEELVGSVRDADTDAEAAGEGGGLAAFLERTALRGETDHLEAADRRPDQVALMTLHNAKGLEFDVVFLTGVEETLLPHQRSMEAGADALDEERRLAYVGITRARKRCFLTFTQRRSIFGDSSLRLPSSFLADLPDAAIVREETQRHRAAVTSRRRRGTEADEPSARRGRTGVASPAHREGAPAGVPRSALAPGVDVIHAAFGEGVVLAVEAGGVVIVRFAGDGSERRLMADYAPLRMAP